MIRERALKLPDDSPAGRSPHSFRVAVVVLVHGDPPSIVRCVFSFD